MIWEICIDGSFKLLCSRYGDQDVSACSTQPQFINRVRKTDDATMEVINMTKEESGVTGCFVESLNSRTYQYNVLLIGNTIIL